MTDHHQVALDAYAPGLSGRLTGVDPEGADLRRGARTARLTFRQPVLDPESVRVELVRPARSRPPTASQ
jgi:hypothetical protein